MIQINWCLRQYARTGGGVIFRSVYDQFAKFQKGSVLYRCPLCFLHTGYVGSLTGIRAWSKTVSRSIVHDHNSQEKQRQVILCTSEHHETAFFVPSKQNKWLLTDCKAMGSDWHDKEFYITVIFLRAPDAAMIGSPCSYHFCPSSREGRSHYRIWDRMRRPPLHFCLQNTRYESLCRH